jgi:hypothetical protein
MILGTVCRLSKSKRLTPSGVQVIGVIIWISCQNDLLLRLSQCTIVYVGGDGVLIVVRDDMGVITLDVYISFSDKLGVGLKFGKPQDLKVQ